MGAGDGEFTWKGGVRLSHAVTQMSNGLSGDFGERSFRIVIHNAGGSTKARRTLSCDPSGKKCHCADPWGGLLAL